MTVTLRDNLYVRTLSGLVRQHDVEQAVCYGLGPVCSAPISQHQLAVLLVLAAGRPVFCFDPVFDQDDLAVLLHFGIQPCAYPRYPHPDTPTLLYMPHCERQLYVDVVQSRNAVIFGNRLVDYPEFKDRNLVAKKLPNEEYLRQDVFNDCYLHYFGAD